MSQSARYAERPHDARKYSIHGGKLAPIHGTVNASRYVGWRSPGRAPVIDACGIAGGRIPGQGPGIDGADYHSTDNAPLGTRGSALPPRRTGTRWAAGTNVEVAFTIKASHGGGYSCVPPPQIYLDPLPPFRLRD